VRFIENVGGFGKVIPAGGGRVLGWTHGKTPKPSKGAFLFCAVANTKLGIISVKIQLSVEKTATLVDSKMSNKHSG
jgi:hypothetical protein